MTSVLEKESQVKTPEEGGHADTDTNTHRIAH